MKMNNTHPYDWYCGLLSVTPLLHSYLSLSSLTLHETIAENKVGYF